MSDGYSNICVDCFCFVILICEVVQVREELINMLKNKETEQSRELTALQQDLEHRMKIVDEVRVFLYFFIFNHKHSTIVPT